MPIIYSLREILVYLFASNYLFLVPLGFFLGLSFRKYFYIKYAVAILLLMIWSCTLSTLYDFDPFSGVIPGGCCGHFFSELLQRLPHMIPQYIVLIGLFVLAMLVLFGVRWTRPFMRLISNYVIKLYPLIYSFMSQQHALCKRVCSCLYRDHVTISDHITLLINDIMQEDSLGYEDEFIETITERVKQEVTDSLTDQNKQSCLPSYEKPSHKLLHGYRSKQKKVSQQELKKLSYLLEEKLSLFEIYGEVVSMVQGPVITVCEYRPEPDCKLSKILALEDDLALALQALSVRILAPLPGTSSVGFEIALRHREMVHFADILSSAEYNGFFIPLVIGKKVCGQPLVVDLTTMPHILVAGTTGSGKSICLHTLLTSFLVTMNPSELKLILIDPKRLEFMPYHDIPHLLFPIVTDPSRAIQVLQWAVSLMEERYEILAQAQVRSCTEYQQQGYGDMPYVVIVVDELADLMMLAGKALEENIGRLAQMARAAGIHLIVATQRPSTEVITGLIKVNFPARIAFKVASKIDSRIILDTVGAEKLVGKGDMLFLDSTGTLIRAHGAFISNSEVKHITDYCRAQQKPLYQELPQKIGVSALADDPLLSDVLEYIKEHEEISISAIQRTFRIGYNRSARLIEQLEAAGKIGPHGQGKKRKVLNNLDNYRK